jgi:hypothetical protein
MGKCIDSLHFAALLLARRILSDPHQNAFQENYFRRKITTVIHCHVLEMARSPGKDSTGLLVQEECGCCSVSLQRRERELREIAPFSREHVPALYGGLLGWFRFGSQGSVA